MYLRAPPSHTHNPAELALSICSSFRMEQFKNGRIDFHEERCCRIGKKFGANIVNGNFACSPTCFSARISLNVYRTEKYFERTL
jgi:hypothetical protein